MAGIERFNIYTQIHKGLRACMCEVLVRVGRVDPTDRVEVEDIATRVRGLIDFARDHLLHEEELIHPALEARRPGSSRESHSEHGQHLETLDLIESSLRILERSPAEERPAAALRLYRQLALFVAENFEHMHVEETENHAALVACYSEAEVFDLHARVVAAVKPAAMTVAMRWMIPASSAPERAAVLGGMRKSAPEPVFAGILGVVRPYLEPRDWGKLSAAIGSLPQDGGLPSHVPAQQRDALAV
jgi:hypothetical protein